MIREGRVSDLRTPAEILEFSDDLRYSDVDPTLWGFLKERLGELVDAAEEGTEARFTAERLRDVTLNDCLHLCDMLTAWEEVVVEGRVERSGHVQALRQTVKSSWNRLIVTAEHFAGHPDFSPRWRQLRYMCLAHAEFMEQIEGELGGTSGDGAHP